MTAPKEQPLEALRSYLAAARENLNGIARAQQFQGELTKAHWDFMLELCENLTRNMSKLASAAMELDRQRVEMLEAAKIFDSRLRHKICNPCGRALGIFEVMR